MNLDQKPHHTCYLNEHLFIPSDCWVLPDAACAGHVESQKVLESVPSSVESAHFVLLCRAMMVG